MFVVGSRGVIAAEERRIRPALFMPMASHAGAVTITARRLAEALYDRFTAAELDRLDIVLMRSDPGRRPRARSPAAASARSRPFPPDGNRQVAHDVSAARALDRKTYRRILFRRAGRGCDG